MRGMTGAAGRDGRRSDDQAYFFNSAFNCLSAARNVLAI